jgi:hypothetical protein
MALRRAARGDLFGQERNVPTGGVELSLRLNIPGVGFSVGRGKPEAKEGKAKVIRISTCDGGTTRPRGQG